MLYNSKQNPFYVIQYQWKQIIKWCSYNQNILSMLKLTKYSSKVVQFKLIVKWYSSS